MRASGHAGARELGGDAGGEARRGRRGRPRGGAGRGRARAARRRRGARARAGRRARCSRPPRRRPRRRSRRAGRGPRASSARSSTSTSAVGGSSCSSARIGAMPTPAPTSSSRSRAARVGGERRRTGPRSRRACRAAARARPALWSPRSLTVIRSRSPAGAAESEYGCACHHSPRRRKRHWRNWPPATGSRSQPAAAQQDRDDARAPRASTPTTRTRWRSERQTGSPTRAADDDARASRATAPSTRAARRDGRRTTRPCRSGARTTGTARGRCRGAPTTTSRRPSAGARAGRR